MQNARKMIERKEYFSQLERWKDKPVIKVVTGIRRCGKSTLMQMFADSLAGNGVERDCITMLNMEDLRNEELLDYHRLHDYVVSRLRDGCMNYVFIDEIQMVPQFQKAINSLYLRPDIDIYLTGSNAYMLSGEISTLLSGRYVEIEMLPLSFAEFRTALPPSTSSESAYRAYIATGSFPYLTEIRDDSRAVDDYLTGLYNTIVVKDLMTRKRMSDPDVLQRLMRYMADNVGNLTTVKRISDTLTSSGRTMSAHTVDYYLDAMCESFIIYPVRRYDIRGREHLKVGQKFYIVDTGLRNIMLAHRGGDNGRVMENTVFLELLRRGYEVSIGKVGDWEVDFIARRDGDIAYYQVALTVRDTATLERELRPLQSIADFYPKFLITMDNDPVVSHNGIKQLYLLDWLS